MAKQKQIFPTTQKGKLNVKKIFLTTLIAICVLLPTFLAVFNIIYADYRSRTVSGAASVTLFDMDGNQLFFEDNSTEYETEASLVNIFRAIQNNLEKSSPISSDTITEEPLVAKIVVDGVTTELTCHFSFTQGASYCVDAAGQYYRIPTAYSEYFLTSTFAEPLYNEATPPSLTTADGDFITPESVRWKYKAIDNRVMSPTLVNTTDEVLTYDTSGSIALTFSEQPDACEVSAYEDGQLIYNGALDGLSTVTLDSSSVVNIRLSAAWNEQVGRRFYGQLDYDINVLVHNRADFSLSTDTLGIGKFAVLRSTNIASPSKLMLTFPDDLTPVTYYVGETAYTAIPYPTYFEGETYSFTVSYGISSRSFDISLDPAAYDLQGQYDTALELFGIGELSYGVSVTDRIFFRTEYTSPEQLEYTRGQDFGDATELDVDSTVLPFAEYVCESGAAKPVYSCFGGRVAYVGENGTLGTYVCVDSGLGIRLWYYGLSTSDVEVGDYVASGDVIGKSGELFSDKGDGFLLMVTCVDTLVAPDFMFENLNALCN